MTRKRPLFSSTNQSPEILRTRWILQKKEAVKESLSGGDMKKWLAVGVVALGTLGLLMMRSTKRDRKSTRLNSSHVEISYAVFCLKKKRSTKVKRKGAR